MKEYMLQAYKNDPKLKTALLKEIVKHRKADQIVQGTYGKENGKWKGCAVGCSLRSLAIINKEKLVTKYDQHARYETDLGIPQDIAHLEDKIFEGLPKEKAVLWPERFIKAIKPGADLSLVIAKFIVWNLNEVEKYAGDFVDVRNAIKTCAELWQRVVDGKEVKEESWSAARSAAESAAESAWSAADHAADSAARSDARSAAWSAAESDAESARSAAYEAQADKLIELLEAAK